MQNEMEKVQEELLNKKAIPVWPKPRARKATKPVVRSGDDHTDNMMEADEANDLQEAVETMEAVENMEDGTTGAKKRKVTKKGRKPLIKDAISNMQKKINEAPSKLEGTASTAATSDAQVPIRKPVVPVAEALIGDFADDIDDTLECKATIAQGKGKSKVASIFEDNVDFDKPNAPVGYEPDDDSVTSFTEQEWYLQGPQAPFTQIDNHRILKQKASGPQAPFTQIDNRRTLKRKASVDDVLDDDEESMVSDWSMDIEGPDFEDTFKPEPKPEPPVVVKKEKDPCMTFSTSVSVVTSVADSKSPAPKKIKVGAPTACAHGTPTIKRQLNVDTVPENMKPCSAYCNVDLPATMQVDQRWAKKYLPTAMLWAGSYEDLWTIPDDILLLHAQLIFNAVYKELNITIVHGSVIHSLTAQRISEWRSNFSSMGLLLGTAHLNAISGYVEVPNLDTHALATGATKMSGVIAICAAAIERALGMFTNKNLKAKDILVSSARGKLVIKLLKVLNKVTGKMTNAPFLFSAARWAKVTTSFIKSISSKPAGYVETTVQMAHACTALNDAIESQQDSLNDDESEDDECAMLCLCHFIWFFKCNKCEISENSEMEWA
ncbi:uncharacterized protein EDB91DRAFT_1079861 [Suillus paluster]|uniref:uncharacterized protein n=1 Tax=Suillus paluster TaxID=48578 RepID=UPI001B86B9C2|nr:uncharacterized protein EDB91DRAFT_1079861 [Suillus paluster]KAG1747267.1 hypothetical protein EDB91DRAFT_1079861 [Suillus paluster]